LTENRLPQKRGGTLGVSARNKFALVAMLHIFGVYANAYQPAATPEDRAWDEAVPMGFGKTVTHALAASGYSLLSNGITMLFNRFVTNVEWALPTADSIRGNFTQPWKWEDNDGFKVNHLGHPIQGMTYFSAGRVMGFGFYSSIFFSAFGSFMWEAFGESQHASINDFYITAPSGASTGEMMYRLYMQAHAAGVPSFVTFFINPTLGAHRLLTGWEPPAVDPALYDFRAYLAVAHGRTAYSVSGPMVGGRREVFSTSGLFADAGFRIVYGDPFTQNTRVPFRHFELLASFGTDTFRQNDFRIFSAGYLFSFSPVHTETRALSHGLSLHYDFASIGELNLHYGTINLYSNALGWSLKYRRLFSPYTGWRARVHAAFTFFGASSYHSPGTGQIGLLNYGYGLSVKHLSGLTLGRRARLEVNNFFYFQWTYPGTGALSQGFVRWQFHDLTFSYRLRPGISLGTTFSVAGERGSFGEFPSTRKDHRSVRTFVAWHGRQ